MNKVLQHILVLILVAASTSVAVTARIKDISRLENVRENQLIGYGLVVGLAGTGDGNGNQATLQGISNMLANFGVQIDPMKLNANNVAAVMVTSKLKAFNVTGDSIDVEVNSIGKAKSLRGGMLLLTPLKAVNGVVYAVAQGAISVGGISASSKGSSAVQNHVTAGRIPNGATVEKATFTALNTGENLVWVLDEEDFSTIQDIKQSLERRIPDVRVKNINASKFTINIPDRYRENIVQLISMVNDVEVNIDAIAKIVINEKTGSVVMGGPIKISPVAIAHESVNITIKNTDSVSQPNALSDGETALVKGSVVTVESSGENAQFRYVKANNSIQDLVSLLNETGASPSEVISILQLMKEAGAIKAKLEII